MPLREKTRRPPPPSWIQAFLLVAAGGEREGGGPVPSRLRPAQAGELLRHALAEGMGGLLRDLLRRRGLDALLPEGERRFLENLYYRAVAENLRRLALIDEVERAFAARGGTAVVLQGAALLFGTYPDPGLRPLTDVDLWAPEREKAREALGAIGFAVEQARPLVLRRGRDAIDLHADPLGAERIESRKHFLPRGAARILAACRPLSPAHPRLLRLSPEDEMLYLAFHAAKHNLERLVWLADLARLSRPWGEKEWRRLEQRARELGAASLAPLAAALAGCPAGRLPAARGGLSVAARFLIRRRLKGRRLPAWAFLVLLRPAGIARRAAFLVESIFPRPAVLCPGGGLKGVLRHHVRRAAGALPGFP
ncbi:MAG: nucleotidyltransferase family protein [Desulfobacterales bacterium]